MRAQFLRQEGEYRCPNCGGFSGVFLSTAASMFGFIAVITSVVVFLVLCLVTGGLPSYGVLFMAPPCALLFFVASFLVRLRKPGMHKRPPVPPRPDIPPPYPPDNRSGQGPNENHSFKRF